jgi:membrane-bound ClpP family serine protease
VATAVRPRLLHAGTDQLLTLATMSLTAGALLLALLQLWAAGAVVAGLALLVGGAAQLMSETRTERFENIIAITLAAVVLMVCLADGGSFVS